MNKISSILIVGPSSGVNEAIVSLLVKEYYVCWVITRGNNTSYDSSITDLENLHLVETFAEQNSEKVLANLPVSKFYGVVFADGIGGVRPAKLNTESFVTEMLSANVVSFTSLIANLLKKRRVESGGSIVALSSVSSIQGLKSKTAYSASKAALDAAVKGMAAELAPKKIRVNSIRKGWVTSDMSLGFIEDNRAIGETDDYNQQLLGAIDPSEIALTVQFLLDQRMKSITGTHLLVDGGYTV